MYFIQRIAFLVLLLHQCIDGFNILDKDIGFNYFNRDINSIASSLPDIKTRWILQEIDHFNSSDKREWKMKYIERLSYWQDNGPIYLYLSGREAAADFWVRRSFMSELAKETHGAMYVLEHRYYGDSKPFKNLDVENMKYLSSRQALADIAKLISYLKSLPMYKDSKVVVIGKTYGGNLAAWMKVLYPKLIDAALSNGAPVLAQKDFYKSLEKVKDDYQNYGGVGCLDRIKKKFEDYESLLGSPDGMNQFKKNEHICDSCNMTVPENQHLFFKYRIDTFIDLSEIGDPAFIYFHCNILDITTDSRSFLNGLSKVTNPESHSCVCYDFNQYINELKDQRNLIDMYPWLYQSCTEFGYFHTTSSKNQPFSSLPLEFYIKTCSALFGNNFNEKRVDEGVEISNKLYGGLKPNVTKVVFMNMDTDPWSTLSILEDLSPDALALVIPAAPNYEPLEEARMVVKYLIKKWIGAKRDDHCDQALYLFHKMQENDIVPSQKFVKNLCSFLKANNAHIPPDLVHRLDKPTKIVSNKVA